MLSIDVKGRMAAIGYRIGTVFRSTPLGQAAKPIATIGGMSAATVSAILLFSHSAAVESALASAMADPAAILAARSPGARAPGALTQTKLAYAPKAPVERVLGQERARPTAVPPGAAAVPLGTPLPVIPADAFGDPLAGAPAPLGGGPGFSPGVGVPVSGFIPGGGGGGGGGGTTPVDPGTPPVSAIPEPSTWLMTILGFFAAGMGLRRRRSTGTTRLTAR
ncbi:PEP-CTERM sorting domain-containing protein [Sphingomonas sp. 1P08PE]|uniref:PEP-CTERM sorting domain-containing protein n=1 Tax=Sphingomonas sp. 1P08PE TaxID=554122 RepID=UPI0039A3E079